MMAIKFIVYHYIFFIVCTVCVGVRVPSVHVKVRTQFRVGSPNFYMGSQDQTQAARLSWKASLPTGLFVGPMMAIFSLSVMQI